MANRSRWTMKQWQELTKRVKEMRGAKFLSHAKIADKLGCSAQTVRNILNGFSPTYYKER